ncbi:phenylacetate 2-hydroxylase [Diplocarpon rosae]|nr:phenylacetate 2-hydroxylase [Diplocarpon rosae]
MTLQTTGIAIVAVIYFLIRYVNRTDTPKVKNLPEIPGLPLFGSLLSFGEQHAKVAGELAKKYGPVFQVRLGNRRIVFANSFDSVRDLWITHQSALISRPILHTFHTVVSSSQGFTIGTSPWDESCKRRRRAAATALNRPAVQTYMPIIDLESCASIKEILEDSQNGKKDIDPIAYFQRFALNTSLTLNYGTRIDGDVNNELLREICDVERAISNFRSTSNNWQDYIPLLRLLPSRSSTAADWRDRRDKYLTLLLNRLKKSIEEGTDKPCITGNILKDPEAKLNEFYPTGNAWEKCLVEEKVPYVIAFVREVLRFFTVVPICLPRTSIKDIQYEDALIPAGMTFYMNAWAADYDAAHFKEPHVFSVERYLDNLEGAGETPHFAYGAGSRMCAGSHLANRELYTAFIRIFTAFEIKEPEREEDRPILDALECNAIPTSLTTDPKPFKVGFRCRDSESVEEWIRESEERTRDL